MKFGEFSEKAFAMLLQDPIELKTMKVAEELMRRDKKRRQKQKKIRKT